MNVQSKGQFYAKFLGSFSLDFNGQRLWLKGSPQKKSMQLLMALLKAGAEGATRQQLLEVVWKEGGDPQKEKSNLNQHLYYLRQLIHESHFPEGKYIIVQKPRYYFTEDYEIHSDTEQLDQILEEIRNAEAAGYAGTAASVLPRVYRRVPSYAKWGRMGGGKECLLSEAVFFLSQPSVRPSEGNGRVSGNAGTMYCGQSDSSL